MSANSNPWIAFREPRPRARVRLFCFPYAGSSAAIYHDWARQFPAHVDVCCIEPPGRFARRKDTAYRAMPAFIRALDDALRDQLDLPCVLFGYSLGALMAFEWAREMRRQQRRSPLHLVVAARKAPHLPSVPPLLSHLTGDAFVEAVEKHYGAFEPAIKSEPEVLALVEDILRVDLAMIEGYRLSPGDPLDCPITVIGGRRDESTPLTTLEAWRLQTTSSFRCELLEGDHFFIRAEGARLISLVRDAVSQATRAEGHQTPSAPHPVDPPRAAPLNLG